MALPDSAKLIVGTPIVIANTTYANNQGMGTRTDQINLTSLAAGAARQSAKLDFTANMDLEYVLAATIEWASTVPVAGETVSFYIGWSNSATAGTNNPGGLSGADAAYTGYSSNLVNSLKQLDFIGAMVATVQATPTVQIDTDVATFTPRARYGTLVVVNNSAADSFHSDAVEMAVSLTPLVTQIQD